MTRSTAHRRPDDAGTKKPVMCAIYTRKSTEEGLQQEFNSLDALRESAEAYIAAQKHEGWQCLPERYDDGGFTGNNLRVAGDIPRRSYSNRLDANAERPWEREGFRIDALHDHVATYCGDLLADGFTVIRGWYAAGKPLASLPTFGSFESWVSTVGSVLKFADVEGFLENLKQTRVAQDEDVQQWNAFFEAWRNNYQTAAVPVDDLCQRLLGNFATSSSSIPDALLLLRDRGDGSLRRSLGRYISRLTGRIFNGYKLCDAGEHGHRKVRAW